MSTAPPTPPAPAPAVADGDPGPSAIELLGQVLAAAAGELNAAATPAAAFRAVAAADRALTAAPEFFAAISAVIARGEPAPEVAADLCRYQEQSAQLDQAIAPLRARYDELARAEDRLRAQAAREEELHAQIVELERIEKLAARVAEIQDQKERLEERVRAASDPVAATEQELCDVAGTLITLSDATLATLTEATRALLDRAREQDDLLSASRGERQRAAAEAERARQELATAEAELAQVRAEYETVHAEAAARLGELRIHQAKNQDVAQAVAGQGAGADEDAAAHSDPLASALLALSEVGGRLAEIDAMLGAALSEGRD
jgi:DNA repair exonuclease SbcCD ATPase subunit